MGKKIALAIVDIFKYLLRLPFRPNHARDFVRYVHECTSSKVASFSKEVERSRVSSRDIEGVALGIYDSPITLHNLQLTNGNMSYQEIYIVSLIARYLNAQNVFEFGTFNGVLTLQLALNTSDKATIHTIDLPSEQIEEVLWTITHPWDRAYIQKPSIGQKFRNHPVQGKIKQLLGDSALFDYTPYYGRMDLVVVDACHQYEYIKSDSENAFKMLRPGGWILWHDHKSDWPDVDRYLEELAEKKNTVFHIPDTHLAAFISEVHK